MRFGLDRMRRLMTTLGPPEDASPVHVVGTNGKSSTARMIAAILQRSGLRTGLPVAAPRSPSPSAIRTGEADVSARFARGRARRPRRRAGDRRRETGLRHAVRGADRGGILRAGRREVDVAVIEAGLGGRGTPPTSSRPRFGADERRSSTHALAGARQCATSRARSSPSSRPPRPGDRRRLHPDALEEARLADARRRHARRGACRRPGRRGWPRPARSSGATSRSRVPPPTRSSATLGSTCAPRPPRSRVPGPLPGRQRRAADASTGPTTPAGSPRSPSRCPSSPPVAGSARLGPRDKDARRCSRAAAPLPRRWSSPGPPTRGAAAGHARAAGPPAGLPCRARRSWPDPRAALDRARELAGAHS